MTEKWTLWTLWTLWTQWTHQTPPLTMGMTVDRAHEQPGRSKRAQEDTPRGKREDAERRRPVLTTGRRD